MRFLILPAALTSVGLLAQQPAPAPPATPPAATATVTAGQRPAQGPKLIPPPGVAIAQADERTLRTGLTRLTTMIDSMKGNPHIADVMIYQRAIKFALEGNGFFAADDVFKGKELLRTGLERADQLQKGDAPWTRATGLVVRGYISKIDGSAQPYGLLVPASYSPTVPHQWRVDGWFHGRTETLSEVNFMWEQSRNQPAFTPRDTIVLSLYGRFCNASTFAGEMDFFEALDDVKKNYPVDDSRVLVRGFSMGGASAWHIGAHYGTDFAAIAPGAGFSETMEFTGQTRRNVKLTWFEDKLMRVTNATDYALNFFNVPVVAYNGDIDAQKQAADIMAKNMEAEGLTLSRVIGVPNIGHMYTPVAKVQLDKMMDAIVVNGREDFPREVKFTTFTLRYNRMKWVTVDGLDKHWDRARVDATIADDHTVQAKTSNVSALTFDLGVGASLLSRSAKVNVVLDGQSIPVAGAMSDGSWTVHFQKTGTKWAVAPVPAVVTAFASAGAATAVALRKVHGVQGPIDDAFLDSFVMVKPTGTPMNETTGKWIATEQDHAVKFWATQMRGDAPMKDDTAITDADIANSNLVLWGDPQSNKVLAKIASKLPIQWTADSVTLGTRKFAAGSNVPVMVYPNPLNPKKYVVINSGMTMREYSESNNALQVAYLPDYAVVDITTPPDQRWPGKIAAVGFFGEKWELLANDGQ